MIENSMTPEQTRKMRVNQLMEKLTERGLSERIYFDMFLGPVGEYIESLEPEERELLKTLKPEDINDLRPDVYGKVIGYKLTSPGKRYPGTKIRIT